jgi:hypothetical protein
MFIARSIIKLSSRLTMRIYSRIKHKWLEDVMETKVRTAVDTAGQCSGVGLVGDLGTGNCGHRHV